MQSTFMDNEALENLWFANRYRNLSPVAEEQLRLASHAYADSTKAEMHLALAKAIDPENPVVHIGEYRYYFYKGRLEEALKVAESCLVIVAKELGLPTQWQQVTPNHANFSSDEAANRFYLFCLKAYAYLLLRMDKIEQGWAATEKLLQLDRNNQVGGQVLLDVLLRMDTDDYDD
jgi:tetratricopeptide (TPR) repeat protein